MLQHTLVWHMPTNFFQYACALYNACPQWVTEYVCINTWTERHLLLSPCVLTWPVLWSVLLTGHTGLCGDGVLQNCCSCSISHFVNAETQIKSVGTFFPVYRINWKHMINKQCSNKITDIVLSMLLWKAIIHTHKYAAMTTYKGHPKNMHTHLFIHISISNEGRYQHTAVLFSLVSNVQNIHCQCQCLIEDMQQSGILHLFVAEQQHRQSRFQVSGSAAFFRAPHN